MEDNKVLVLERSSRARARMRKAIEQRAFVYEWRPSIRDALLVNWRNVAAVVADLHALTEESTPSQSDLRMAIETLRRAKQAALDPDETRLHVNLAIILTSDQEDVQEHAKALAAGADLYLSAAAAEHAEIIGSYLVRFLREQSWARERTPDLNGVTRVAEAFTLPTDRLRAESGRLDAGLIAAALGVPLARLAHAIGVPYTTVHKTPDSTRLQTGLAPFANVLAMLDEIYDGDDRRVRAWLQSERPELAGRTPQAALLEPGGAAGVEQYVTGAWLGEPE